MMTSASMRHPTGIAPLVTIGFNAFNAEDTVAPAIASALAQNWPNREIVIVDDASSDGTAARLRELTAGRSEIRLLVNQSNLGLGASRNRIIEEAKGEFIVLFDDDDVSEPDRVAVQVQRILDYERDHANGAMVLCHAARMQNYPDGSRRIERTMGENEQGRAPAGEAVARRILLGTPLENGYGSCAGCSQAARKSTFESLGGFDVNFRRGQDTDFCIRAARAGAHFVGVSTPLVTQTMTSSSDKGLERLRQHALQMLEKHRDFFASEDEYCFTRNWMELKHDWLAGRQLSFFGRLASVATRHPLLTLNRIRMALPQMEGNHAFRRFHGQSAT